MGAFVENEPPLFGLRRSPFVTLESIAGRASIEGQFIVEFPKTVYTFQSPEVRNRRSEITPDLQLPLPVYKCRYLYLNQGFNVAPILFPSI